MRSTLSLSGSASSRPRRRRPSRCPDRKRLELAKSLAMRPRVLMLDEVNAGLNTGEIDSALDLIRRISANGVTIVIIEHLMKVVFSLSHRILVLHQGALISQGKPSEVAEDERVIRAYLGTQVRGSP